MLEIFDISPSEQFGGVSTKRRPPARCFFRSRIGSGRFQPAKGGIDYLFHPAYTRPQAVFPFQETMKAARASNTAVGHQKQYSGTNHHFSIQFSIRDIYHAEGDLFHPAGGIQRKEWKIGLKTPRSRPMLRKFKSPFSPRRISIQYRHGNA